MRRCRVWRFDWRTAKQKHGNKLQWKYSGWICLLDLNSIALAWEGGGADTIITIQHTAFYVPLIYVWRDCLACMLYHFLV